MNEAAEPIQLQPIGYVRHGQPDDVVKESWAEMTARIDVVDELADGLEKIEGFSHLIVLYWMHRLREGGRSILQIKPRGLMRHGLTLDELPQIGVFASDAPVRPNPIGLTMVELLGREGNTLNVRGLDAFDEAPVLDIKPYTEDRIVAGARMAAWHEDLLRKTGAKRV
ncbi:MAG: tRNA (N6-threonylcarbamoyladenosine(37)-N6)-methyltransferase TrmO [Actinomycetota bacterium]